MMEEEESQAGSVVEDATTTDNNAAESQAAEPTETEPPASESPADTSFATMPVEVEEVLDPEPTTPAPASPKLAHPAEGDTEKSSEEDDNKKDGETANEATEVESISSVNSRSSIYNEVPLGMRTERSKSIGKFRLDAINVDSYGKEISETVVCLAKQGLGVSIKDYIGQTLIPGVVVTHVAPGGACAQQSKITVGDTILKVNGKSVVGMKFQDIVKWMRSETLASGSKKGKVTIDYIREQKIFEVEMERKEDEDYGFILRGNKIIEIEQGSVADKATLQLNHYILSINGSPVVDLDTDDITGLIKSLGSKLTIHTMPPAVFLAQKTGQGF
eukprot:m.114185 g.114185  ORF g.114185 m.114185 type:complete len:331 (-) comp14155_c0_seq5:1231-2223(-)